MSIASRARNTKQPTPESGNPRWFGKMSHRPRIKLSDEIRLWHAAAKSAKIKKTRGAFSGVTLAARKQRIAAALVSQ